VAKNAWMKGRRAIVKYDIETRGGTRFPAGSVCRVDYVDRGKLCLSMPNPDELNIFGPRYIFILKVQSRDVEIVPLPPNKLCPCPHSPGTHSSVGCMVRNCNCEWTPKATKTEPAPPIKEEPVDDISCLDD
jgi:hypothetical protein